MVQASNEPSRKTDGETGKRLNSTIPFIESDIPQKDQAHTGWYYHSERDVYCRWDEYIKSV